MTAGLGRKNPDNWRLYHLLELEPPVTSKQVQWTFRKVTLRHHFYQAYLVLYDEDRKSLYDALGEDAVQFIHSGSWGPLMHLLGARASIKLYSALMLLALFLLLTFFIFLGLQDDGYISWSPTSICIPLVALAVIGTVVTAAAAIVSFFWKVPWEEGMLFLERVPALGNFLAALFYTVFVFLATIGVSTGAEVAQKFIAYFWLLIAGDSAFYLSSLVWRWPRIVRLSMEVGINRPSPFLCYSFFLMAFVYIALSFLQWIVLLKKLDGSWQISWYVAFVPFALHAALRILEAFLRSMSRRAIGMKTGSGLAFDTLGAFFFNGLIVVSLYFVGVHLTLGNRAALKYSLIPVYILLIYLVLCTIATLVYLLSKDTENRREERLNNLKWVPVDSLSNDQSGPLLFQDIDGGATTWDEINDRNTPISRNKKAYNSEDYDDLESDEEEELINAAPSHQLRAPYAEFDPPDEFNRLSSRSRPRSHFEGPESERQRHVHQDPYDPKTDAAPGVGNDISIISSEEDDYDEDAPVSTDISSSMYSSTFLTSKMGSPRQ